MFQRSSPTMNLDDGESHTGFKGRSNRSNKNHVTRRRHSSWAGSRSSAVPKVKSKRSTSDASFTRINRTFQTQNKKTDNVDDELLEYVGKLTKHLSIVQDLREKEKTELKSRIEELEQYKSKYNQQKEENERLQKKVDHMLLGQSDTSQKLLKANENLDKVRLENKKKTEQIEKFQKDMRSMEDRMRNLEIRASEVEKAELILETTRQNLESTQAQVRAREGELRRLTRTFDEKSKQLELSNDKIKNMEEKMKDLNYQVRHELIRNENIEKNLETIPRLKEDISDQQKQIQALEKELEEKAVLLAAARKAVREYRDQLRDVEKRVSKADELQQELDIAESEVTTLKRLMQGKDFLVAQKSKALDLAKDVIETMRQSTDKEQIDKILIFLEKIGNRSQHRSSNSNLSDPSSYDEEVHSVQQCRPYSAVVAGRGKMTVKSEHGKNINVNRPPYPQSPKQRSKTNNAFYELTMRDSYDEDLRPKTAVVRPTVKRTSSFKDHITLRSSSSLSKRSQNDQRISSASRLIMSPVCSSDSKSQKGECPESLNRSFDIHDSGYQAEHTPRSSKPAWIKHTKSELSLSSDLSSLSSDDNVSDDRPSSARLTKLMKLSSKQREDILCNFVNVGDRVLISVQQKPPKYGKKIVPKPKIYTGIVKYRGTMDKQGYDPRTYIGVRLDSEEGDTDGSVRGKRYMYTPSDQGKFFKLLDVDSVLDVQDGRYRTLASMLAKHVLNVS